MSDKPLPCPFCGGRPEILCGSPNWTVVCRTSNCVMWDNPQPPRAWNTRAPVAEPVVGKVHLGAEAARMRVLSARSRVIDDMRRRGSTSTLTEAANDLTDAFNVLDALRPPAAPVSVAFWLGREAS